MRIETDHAEIATALERTAATIRAEGGFIADDLIVRERGGQISCAIGERFGVPGRILISYPQQLTVPMHLLEWVDRSDALELADPEAARAALQASQWRLLKDWLVLINAVDRMSHVRASMPRFALADPAVRHHLANAGYPTMRTSPSAAGIRESVIAWHSMSAGQGTDGGPRFHLIPLKHLFNHHPTGADQTPVPGRTAVATSSSSDATETFENYGDLDGLQLLLTFGYVDDAAPQLHSVPLDVESSALGRVVVRWRAPRNLRAEVGRDVPNLLRLDSDHLVRPDVQNGPDDRHGIALHHLTFRPDNRARVAAYLAMACQSMAGLNADAASREAENILDAILEANQAYYRRLDELVIASADPFLPLAQVSLLQQQRLANLWS